VFADNFFEALDAADVTGAAVVPIERRFESIAAGDRCLIEPALVDAAAAFLQFDRGEVGGRDSFRQTVASQSGHFAIVGRELVAFRRRGRAG
jgi:hypothetical protein